MLDVPTQTLNYIAINRKSTQPTHTLPQRNNKKSNRNMFALFILAASHHLDAIAHSNTKRNRTNLLRSMPGISLAYVFLIVMVAENKQGCIYIRLSYFYKNTFIRYLLDCTDCITLNNIMQDERSSLVERHR